MTAAILYSIGIIVLLLVRKLWRSGIAGQIIVVMITGFLAWDTYRGLYPPNDFFIKEFYRLTKIDLSDSEILETYTSVPDFFGDYSGCFTASFNEDNFVSFKDKIGLSGASNSTLLECPLGRAIFAAHDQQIYDLDALTAREDARILVYLAPENRSALVAWSLW